MKIILGIDPGSKVTGYGFIEIDNSNINYLFGGYIDLKEEIFFKKLKIIYNEIDYIIKKYNPSCSAIERIFVGKNMDSAIKLSHARSAAIVALMNYNIPTFEYTTTQIKKYLQIKNYNNKNKIEIKNIIKNLLKLSINLKQDIFDALAIAITHYYKVLKNY